jgi:hypothetical protein
MNITKQYDLVKEDTYGKASYNLIQSATSEQPQFTLEDGSKIYRPNTFKENLIARIDNPEFFKYMLDSCTGIAYNKGTSLVKINPITKELITLDKDFNGYSIDIIYNDFKGEEIDVDKISKKDKWLVAMGGREDKENVEVYYGYKAKLIEFQEDIYERKLSENEKDSLMNFYTLNNLSKDQLRAVYVFSGGQGNSGVGGGRGYHSSHFARIKASETHK